MSLTQISRKMSFFKDLAGLTKYLKNTKSFDQVFNKVNIVSLGGGKCTAELKIEEEHTNPMGGLHGGLSATLIDVISTFALNTKFSANLTHVSVDMHISYLKGAKIGDDILIEADTIKTGKTLAFLEVLIKNKNSGDLLVKGSHTKYIFQK